MGWGGAREGAGRTPRTKKRKRSITLYLTDTQWRALEMEAEEKNTKLGTLINTDQEARAEEFVKKFSLEEVSQATENIENSE